MMRLFCILLPLVTVFMSACSDGGVRRETANADRVSDDGGMTVDMLLPTTPMKNQGHSTLCWIYAPLAVIETDRIAMGDSVNLSADYLVRKFLSDKALEIHLGGNVPSLRGMMPTALRLMERYGIVGYDAYHARKELNMNALACKMARAASARSTAEKMRRRVELLLDTEIGYLPARVYMLGAGYTPVEFAHSVYQPGDWQMLTSFTHHPYGENFVLETPDNVLADKFLNLPLDSMMLRIEASLRQGHPVGWEGDISEKGFDVYNGVAVLGNENAKIDAHMRQKAFECRNTTDDHCMALVGIAHDHAGKKYFIAKNSWGTIGKHRGFVYLSENYVRMKTIALMVRRLN